MEAIYEEANSQGTAHRPTGTQGKGKGRSKGKGKRRRLHGRGILAVLASLTGPHYEDIFLGADTSGKCKERRGNPKDTNGKTM
eukprot:7873488-Pyramimonas_sp.AAC.1